MTRPGIETRSPGPLANTLPTQPTNANAFAWSYEDPSALFLLQKCLIPHCISIHFYTIVKQEQCTNRYLRSCAHTHTDWQTLTCFYAVYKHLIWQHSKLALPPRHTKSHTNRNCMVQQTFSKSHGSAETNTKSVLLDNINYLLRQLLKTIQV